MKTVTKTRLYPACHSGDIQAIKAGSSLCAHKFTIQICGGGKGKWMRTSMPTKNTIYKIKNCNE